MPSKDSGQIGLRAYASTKPGPHIPKTSKSQAVLLFFQNIINFIINNTIGYQVKRFCLEILDKNLSNIAIPYILF